MCTKVYALMLMLFADDRRMKTEQLLLTSPVSIFGMVSAKFLAAYTIFAGTYAVSCLVRLVFLSFRRRHGQGLLSRTFGRGLGNGLPVRG